MGEVVDGGEEDRRGRDDIFDEICEFGVVVLRKD